MIELEIPKDLNVQYSNGKLIIKGPKGSVERDVPKVLTLTIDGSKITLSAKKSSLVKPFALEKTWKAHILNMFKGVTEGYEKKLKVIYAHFPFVMEKKNNEIIIKNFLGEKVPRIAKVNKNVDIKISKSEVILSSPDIEALGQTYLSLKRATKIKDKDPRIFQDGLYLES